MNFLSESARSRNDKRNDTVGSVSTTPPGHPHSEYLNIFQPFVEGLRIQRADEACGHCPFHDDNTPSFCVNIATGLWVCHGCGAKGNVEQFSARVRALSNDEWWKTSNWSVAALYSYKDETGTILFQVVRTRPKGFYAQRPDGAGGWKKGTGDRRVVYRLPEVVSAVFAGRLVYVTEGEKDADALVALGLEATTNPFGAEKWSPDYNRFFRNARVAIVPDNDDAGRHHAELVASSLYGTAAEIKILRLPDLEEKGDVSDWLAQGHSGDELEKMVESTHHWAPPTPSVSPHPDARVLGTVEQPRPSWHIQGTSLWSDNHQKLDQRLEPIEVMEEGGRPQGAVVDVIYPDGQHKRVVMPVSVVTERDPATTIFDATGIAWTPKHARNIQSYLGEVVFVQSSGVKRVQVITRPGWRGDKPILPGGELRLLPTRENAWLALYGRHSDTDENNAKAAWRDIVGESIHYPRLTGVMGGAAISLYLTKIGRPPFIVHLFGDSTLGKTRGLKVAMAPFGFPEPDLGILKTWNATANSILERLRIAAILPVALDELAAAGMKDERIEAVLFGAAGGASRSRAGRSGGLQDEGGWRLVVLSSGERRITSVSGLSGARARVLELPAPVTSTADQIDSIHRLALAHYGWPLAWLREGNASPDLVSRT